MKIAVFVGSLQESSYNKKLAKNLEALSPEGVEFEYVNIAMPLFNQDLEEGKPEIVTKAKQIVELADAVLFVTPEYNRSVPGVLKNAIDWVSRPYGFNSFKDKPAGIVGATINIAGTAAAQAELRNILSYLQMRIMGQPEVYIPSITSEIFNESGTITDERWERNLRQYMEALTAFVRQ